MTNVLDSNLDELSKLKWRPYVGDNYLKSDIKILFVGESHYDSLEGKNSNIEKKDFTRWIVDEMGIQELDYSSRKLFKNLNLLFSKSKPINFWNKISFYNLIQRPMLTIEEKPKTKDFREGWECFKGVVDILKPDYCIFLGTTSANYFNKFCLDNKLNHEKVTWHEKINGTYLKKAKITIDEADTELIFIKHPSIAFSVDKWLNILNKNYPQIISEITL